MAGVLENVGVNLPKINSINWGNAGLIILGIIIFLVVGVVTFFIVMNKTNKKKYVHKILFAKEVNGKIFLTGEDYAKELIIPYTSIKVFYLKQMKTYSQKLVYDVGKNLYLILIGKGGEWINTDLRYGLGGIIELNDTLKPTRDYANENLKELIKRNWTDKNKDWWKANAQYIFLIILGVIIIVGCILIFVQVKKASGMLNGASINYLEASKIYSEANSGLIDFIKEYFKTSGVISTTPITGG